MRRGFSLLEMIVAFAILAIGAISLVDALSGTRRAAVKLDVLVTGQLLAESVLDSALHRFRRKDRRFFTLGTAPATLIADAAAGKWRVPFAELACPRTAVTAATGNPYFDPATGPVLPDASVPEARRWLDRFSYEVRVDFDIVGASRTAPVPIDADGDGRPEIDVAELVVEVFHRPEGEPAARSVSRLSTLVTAPDKAPGVGALTTP